MKQAQQMQARMQEEIEKITASKARPVAAS